MFSSSKPKFDPNKVKVNLKMLINRLNLLTSKKGNLAKAEKRKVAELLRDAKEHNARILVEQIIRDDYLLEAYDLIKQYTEMLIARFNVISLEAELKPEIAASVCAIVYAGYLMGSEIDELKMLYHLFTIKYGKPVTADILENKEKYINHRFLKILTMTEVPDSTVVDAYLEAIAAAFGVEYVPHVAAQVQPISATLGIALPTPGQPMPGTAVPDPIDLSGTEESGPAGGGIPMGTPPPPMPTATAAPIPMAESIVPVAPLTGPEAPGAQMPYRVLLTKVATASKDGALLVTGFGLTIDTQDVVMSTDAAGATPGVDTLALSAMQPGDKLVALNNRQLTAEFPFKSIAADIDIGAQVAVDLVRYGGGAIGTGGGSSSGAASSQQPTQPVPVVPTPPMAMGSGAGRAPQIEQPTIEGGPVPTAAVPAGGLDPGMPLGPPPMQVPPAPPQTVAVHAASVPPQPVAPTAEDSMEDMLKRRLDALKVGN